MSIKDIPEKIKPYLAGKAQPVVSKIREGLNIKEDVFIVVSIILIGLAGFGLGKLSALEKGRDLVQIKPANFTSNNLTPVKTSAVATVSPVPLSAAAMVSSENAKGLLVASKSGTKYHFPWCSGASQITEKNKIWFDSYEEAQKAGYTAASNCKGLK
jgi:hypothetical protein